MWMSLGAVIDQLDLFVKPEEKSPLDIVRVEISGGHAEELTPGHPAMKWRRVKDYLGNEKGFCYYVAKSGLHKELRRGNVARSVAFARILERYKPGTARGYMRKILFEETRSIALLARFYTKMPTVELAKRFALTRKDWEIQEDRGIFSPDWYRVAREIGWDEEDKERDVDWPGDCPTDPDGIVAHVEALCAAEEWEKLYRLCVIGSCWRPASKRIGAPLRRGLVNVLQKRFPEWRKTFERLLSTSYHDEELCGGMWLFVQADRETLKAYSATKEDPGDEPFEIPYVEDYVYDVHTWVGKKRMSGLPLPQWGVPMPGKLDFRYSGAYSGTLWRYIAFRTTGTLDHAWEKIVPTVDVLEDFHAVGALVI